MNLTPQCMQLSTTRTLKKQKKQKKSDFYPGYYGRLHVKSHTILDTPIKSYKLFNYLKFLKIISILQSINIFTNNLNELHKKICVNIQISWKAVFVSMCRVRFKLGIFIISIIFVNFIKN